MNDRPSTMLCLNPKKWSLGIKLSLTLTTVVAIVGFLIGSVMLVHEWNRAHEALGESALLLSQTIATTAPKAMLRKDFWTLYSSLKNMESGKHRIKFAMILDANGIVLAHLKPAQNPLGLAFRPENEVEHGFHVKAMNAREPFVISSGGFDRNGYQEGVVPIFSDQKYLGVVRIRLSVAQLYETAWGSALIVLAIVLFLVVAGSALGILISRRMVEPLAAVTRGLEAAGRGEMTDFTPVTINDADEIGRLGQTFNQIMVEMAEKKMLEEEVAMSQKLVALGRITAGVAHEVNNPLAGLLNCLDTLRKHPDDEKLIKRYLPVIDQGLHRIKDIVNNLLVGLKIEEGEDIVEMDHIDKLRDLIDAEIGERDIKIEWSNELGKDFPVSTKLEQIVCNLLKNALEALTNGGIISVRIYRNNEFLTVEVRDNGPGIPSEIKRQLFDPFFTTKENGTGLGLWVVYRLTQNLKGVIELESEKDGGTVFNVSVPVINTKAA